MDRHSAPVEEDQLESYAAIAEIIGHENPLICRTLDLGPAQPLTYLPVPAETNPFLGRRGIRMGLDRPYLLRPQVRAILRASQEAGNMQIMFPMIATLDEWQMARAVVDEEVENLGLDPVPVGIMIGVLLIILAG